MFKPLFCNLYTLKLTPLFLVPIRFKAFIKDFLIHHKKTSFSLWLKNLFYYFVSYAFCTVKEIRKVLLTRQLEPL
jgi:hypothetical protein